MAEDPPHTEANGQTRLAYILGVPLADNVVRQWPQMQEIVQGRELIGAVEGNFAAVTLEVGRRHSLGQTIVVEWSINYGDDRIFRNATIAEVEDGKAIRVTDYWGEPVETPEWRKGMTDRLEMPGDGIWPSKERLKQY